MYMNKLIKKQLILILFTVVLVGTLVVTTSFAVFEDTKSNAQDQKMAVGDLNITFTGGSAINITNLSPMTDTAAKSQTNNLYTFSIANTGTVPYKFTVKLENNPSYTSNLLSHKYIRYSLNNATVKFVSDNSGLLVEGMIEAGVTNNYSLRLWVADAETYKLPDSTLGQEIHLKINVDGKAGVIPAPAPDGWYDASSGTLLAAIKRDNTVTVPTTTPGAEVSSSTEAVLASTEDDYGTSYYFRGAVKNNYVQFANKCWRIVRVGGDGSVKLILHNDNTAGAANPCNSANNSTSAAFAHYDGDTYKSAFNTKYDDNAYVGFMYGTAGSSTYDATHANINKSTILTNLETWYTNNLKTYADAITDNVWCNDKTNVTDTSYNPVGWSNVNGYGYAKNVTYYGATQRLISTSASAGGTGPSLKCNGELSKITSKVGLITADELAFAGYAGGLGNTTTYLQENASNDSWWSLSSFGFNGFGASVWDVLGGGGSFVSDYVNDTYAVRPSISLKSTTNVSGDGTSSSPYIISM